MQTTSHRLRSNAAFGLLGFVVPASISVFSYPVLIGHLGAGVFGVYVLSTSLSGAMSILDLGCSTATTKYIAEDLSNDNLVGIAEVIATSVAFYILLGILGTLAVWLTVSQIVLQFHIEPGLRGQARTAFVLAAAQIPLFLLNGVLSSVFKGLRRFEYATVVLSATAALTYGAAIVAVVIGRVGLVGVNAASLFAEGLVLAYSVRLVFRVCGKLDIPIGNTHPSMKSFRRMVSFGSIMTVNSISGLLLYQMPRYVASWFIGPTAVTIYQCAIAGPAKVQTAIGSATEIMFPTASANQATGLLRAIYLKMLAGSAGSAFAALLILLCSARWLIPLWIGPKLGAQVIPLLLPLTIAYGVLSLSPPMFHLLNGLGRPAVNTAFYALNAVLTLLGTSVASIGGFTLLKLVWAFAISNVMTALCYQLYVEVVVWRRCLLNAPNRLNGVNTTDVARGVVPTR